MANTCEIKVNNKGTYLHHSHRNGIFSSSLRMITYKMIFYKNSNYLLLKENCVTDLKQTLGS